MKIKEPVALAAAARVRAASPAVAPLPSSPSKKISLFLLTLSLAAAAQTSSPPAVPARIEQLAWMAGSWSTPAGDFEIEELWMVPKGGLMLGLGRTTRLGKALEFEFMRIEQQGPTLVYLASPGGKPATPFPLVALDASSAAFESALEFPRRVSYRRNPDGTLTARIEGVREGRPAMKEWTWRRTTRD
jgi:hypothetical protein